MEQLKTARANRKRALTKACNTTERVTVEQEHDAIVAHRRHLMATFRLFEDAANAYAAELENKEEITTAEGYYDQEEKHYVKSMSMLNCAMEKLSLNSRPSERSANSVAAMSQVLNMPKLEFESFDGSPSQFHRFMSIFKQVIEPATPDATLRLTRLLCHTTGEAHDSISSVDPGDPECYNRACDILKRNYGSKYVVCTTVVNSLKNGPVATTPKAIRCLANKLLNAEVCLKREGMFGELDNQGCIVSVYQRLSKDLRSKWASRTTMNQRHSSEYLTFSDFVKFVDQEADRLNDPIFGKESFETGSSLPDGAGKKTSTSLVTSTQQTDGRDTSRRRRSFTCVICSNNHKLYYCNDFRDMSVDDRMKLVSKHNLCINCLFPNHSADACRRPYLCNLNNCK